MQTNVVTQQYDVNIYLYFPPGCVLDPQGSHCRNKVFPLNDVRGGLNKYSGLFLVCLFFK